MTKKVRVAVQFAGRTSMVIDTEKYPHYFEKDEARGGLPELIKDVFYDEADLDGFPFERGATEIWQAEFDEPEEVA